MRDTIRKLKKLARGIVTGKTACRHCGHKVSGRNPKTILENLGYHLLAEHPEIPPPPGYNTEQEQG